ncbi:MAG: NUDIX domain-containing protein [Prevotellaceae bacterium]|jgi:mutator protein MutT|nr:NUDIX domain-containing protein [Prevotellaceae bacterium]
MNTIENHYPSKEWKHCQYCGDKHIEWERGTHKMICKTCNRTFFINAAAAVIAIIKNDRGEYLFTRRKNEPAAGKLDFPGGFVDIEETAENAVAREISEELNLNLTEIQYFKSLPNRYLYGGITYFTLDLVYFCKYENLSGISANDDISDFVFMDIKNVSIDDVGLESVKKIVAELKN